mgnify:CR=1 FL=1
MKAHQKIELTPEQREEVERKEARNKLIAIGVTVVTAVLAGLLDRHLEKKLIDQYTHEESEILEEG